MKFIKALYHYLTSKKIASDPSLNIVFKTVKDLDHKDDLKNIKACFSPGVAKRKDFEDILSLSLINI